MVERHPGATRAAVQAAWLESQLDAVLERGEAVVTASRYPTTRGSVVRCPFTTSHEMIIDSLLSFAHIAVARFRLRGGEFACHLVGHCHRDGIVSRDGTPVQYDNTAREAGHFSQDLSNLATVDRKAGTVTLRRIGADVNGDDSLRRTMTLDCRSGRILSE